MKNVNYIDKIIGKSGLFTFEHRLFNSLMFISIIIFLTSFIINFIVLFSKTNYITLLMLLVFTVLSYIIYYLSRFKNKMYALPMILISLLLLNYLWIIEGGSKGSISINYIFLIIFSTLLLSKIQKYFVFIMIILSFCVLFSVEYFFTEIIVIRNSPLIRFISFVISTFIMITIIQLFMNIIVNAYRNQKEKSDSLMHNLLPKKIISELLETGSSKPRKYQDVTVLFTDFAGFTAISSKETPETVISELNDIYTAFDHIAQKHYCERIKTIGDAYLCVCGLPEPNPNHAINIANCALKFRDYLIQRNLKSEIQWIARIGIHSGDVVAGIVGTDKYIYDVFGDTINTASRMEQLSENMKITISNATFQLVQKSFQTHSRGKLPVKGKGELELYFLEPQTL
jgi:adenylate cyclase